MKYRLLIEKTADKYLRKLSFEERKRLMAAIVQMAGNPAVPSLHIKKLKQTVYWRLRVGGYRVIFDREDKLRILRILKIGPRGDVYK
ncbi:MAG: type II toxin-antitoxin system RelE/ParE family toxin [Mariprofundaceae bacterium]|nr:type II toxin-antitoxin system RelE/ParE family toxin [Mariprofundaceae bacterium]